MASFTEDTGTLFFYTTIGIPPYYPKLDETERELLYQLGGILGGIVTKKYDQDTDTIAIYELPTEFFVQLIDIDATLTGIVDQVSPRLTKSTDEHRYRRTLQLVDDGRVLRQEIDRLAQELGVRDW